MWRKPVFAHRHREGLLHLAYDARSYDVGIEKNTPHFGTFEE
jgi:hypothetical protein